MTVRGWRWFGGPMLKLRMSFGRSFGEMQCEDAFEFEGEATFEQLTHLATAYLDAREGRDQARVDALTARARATNDALAGALPPSPTP